MKSQMRRCIEQSVGRVSSAAACVPGPMDVFTNLDTLQTLYFQEF